MRYFLYFYLSLRSLSDLVSNGLKTFKRKFFLVISLLIEFQVKYQHYIKYVIIKSKNSENNYLYNVI